MTVTTRQHVTDVFAVPVQNAELVPVDSGVTTVDGLITPSPARTQQRTLFTRVVQGTGEPVTDDPVRAHLQSLIDKKYEHLCVCSPNRSDMLAADAEMKAHPGYADYKARRDAAMAAHSGCC